MKIRKLILPILLFLFCIGSCTKLKEEVQGNLTTALIDNTSSTPVLLRGVYSSLEYTFTSYQEIFALSDITTDEAIVPTRANNWDDNGVWRELHQQKWNSNNARIHDCFNSLGGVIFSATDLLRFKPSVSEEAQARYLRAFAMYWLLDLFNQVPYRDPGENVILPARVRVGSEALDYIISELNAVGANLPDGPVSVANKYAAKVLLMKCYLNKAVYANRANPAFDVADMNQVISLADDIIQSNRFSFSANYYDNFSPVNGSLGKENIFTQLSNADGNYVVSFAWLATLNYPQNGFNGFTTLPNFYNSFDTADKRRGSAYSYPGSPPNPGNRVNVGFLVGPQYDLNTDAPLGFSYTPEVLNIELGPDLTDPGIRAVKYAPDYSFYYFWNGPAANNFVYFRLSDVLLMKAEAILRQGSPTNAGPYGNSALSLVNAVRTDPSRGAPAWTTVTLDKLLDERGRELWWENWRRQDLIRFGAFLKPFQQKDYVSDPTYLIFPIPDEQIAVNQNLIQNPGY